MNFSKPFIFRPIMTVLLMISFVLAGALGYFLLPVSSLPKMDFPTIQVSALFPGASSETMARSVALPLERLFSSIAGLDSMNSVNSQGMSQITLQFDLDRNIDAAAQDVNSAITAALKSLPASLPTPPSYKKINPSEQPILYLTLTSETLPLSMINTYASTFIADRISMVSGVAQVDVQGNQKYAVRIYADPELLKVRNLALEDLSAAVSNANVYGPAGQLNGKFQSGTLSTNSTLQNAKDFEDVVIAERNGIPIRIKDVAESKDSVQNDKTASWNNGERAITIGISMQPGANSVETVDRVRALLPQLQSQLPSSLNVKVIVDRTESVRDSLHDVKYTFFLIMALVIAVIFLFLRNVRATLIPSITLPISIIGSFGLMYYLGFSLNNLTLLALTLAIGYIVDDAIVVLENISRYIEKGESSLEAALKGSQEIGFTVISMTLSLTAVFIPLLFMTGVVGRLFHEFSMTIVIIIMISGFVSLTLTPMMTRFFLTSHHSNQSGWLIYFENLYTRLADFYKFSLFWAMKRQKQVLYFFFFLFILNIFLFSVVSKGFFPTEDTGLINGTFETTAETSFEKMEKINKKVIKALSQDQDIEELNTSIGGNLVSNTGRLFIRLKPMGVRHKSIGQKIGDFRKILSEIPEIDNFLQPVPNLKLGSLSSKSQYQFTLQGSELKTLYKFTQDFEQELKKTPGFLDVATNLQLNLLEADVNINRERASRLGVSVLEIMNILNNAFGDQQISTIYTDVDSYQVILSVSNNQRKTLEDISNLFVRSSSGNLIRLDTLATFKWKSGPLTVSHYNEIPSTTVSFNLDKNTSLGDAVQKIKDLEESMHRPLSITSSFQGDTQVFKSLQSQEIWLILAAIITIYIILGMLYESYVHPLTILSGLPTAGIGALLALIITGMNLDVISLIGLIMLIGIVKKNAIMMIDYALIEQRENHKSCEEAIIEAALRRFRPIMMTTCAAFIGVLPITLGLGAGAELRQPLGVAVAGGLLVSQLLTLYITPVIYVYLDRLSQRVRKIAV